MKYAGIIPMLAGAVMPPGQAAGVYTKPVEAIGSGAV
jgi:hypothetical protein